MLRKMVKHAATFLCGVFATLGILWWALGHPAMMPVKSKLFESIFLDGYSMGGMNYPAIWLADDPDGQGLLAPWPEETDPMMAVIPLTPALTIKATDLDDMCFYFRSDEVFGISFTLTLDKTREMRSAAHAMLGTEGYSPALSVMDRTGASIMQLRMSETSLAAERKLMEDPLNPSLPEHRDQFRTEFRTGQLFDKLDLANLSPYGRIRVCEGDQASYERLHDLLDFVFNLDAAPRDVNDFLINPAAEPNPERRVQ